MGQLHHVIGANQSQALGRIDVLFIPIDGLMTMSFEEVMLSIKRISPKLVIPMHFFGEALTEQIWAYALGAGRPHPA